MCRMLGGACLGRMSCHCSHGGASRCTAAAGVGALLHTPNAIATGGTGIAYLGAGRAHHGM